jgi:hypothetical protein
LTHRFAAGNSAMFTGVKRSISEDRIVPGARDTYRDNTICE